MICFQPFKKVKKKQKKTAILRLWAVQKLVQIWSRGRNVPTPELGAGLWFPELPGCGDCGPHDGKGAQESGASLTSTLSAAAATGRCQLLLFWWLFPGAGRTPGIWLGAWNSALTPAPKRSSHHPRWPDGPRTVPVSLPALNPRNLRREFPSWKRALDSVGSPAGRRVTASASSQAGLHGHTHPREPEGVSLPRG